MMDASEIPPVPRSKHIRRGGGGGEWVGGGIQ